MARICINGTFLSEKRTGIYRFAEEIIKALDLQENKDELVLVVPPKTEIPFKLKYIKVAEFGVKKGIIWEQIFFALYLWIHQAIALNLCNVTPVLAPTGFSVIHDISYKVNPKYFNHFYGKLSRTWHCFQYWVISHFSRRIFTVSEFSKSEIMRVYHVSPEKITVTPNGWQHMLSIKPSPHEILNRFNLQSKRYFMSLSTIAPNKNLKWVLNAARNTPDTIFAIAGSLNPARFGEDLNVEGLDNVKFLGYVSDGDFVTLAKNCKAFIFPSFYEGFGIPPLEAMSVGASVVISNIPVLKEIFNNSAYYIDPYEKTGNLESLLTGDVSDSEDVLNRFSWDKSAGVMKKCFRI